MVGLPELKLMNNIEFLLKLGFQVFPLSNLTGLTFQQLEIIFKFSYKFWLQQLLNLRHDSLYSSIFLV